MKQILLIILFSLSLSSCTAIAVATGGSQAQTCIGDACENTATTVMQSPPADDTEDMQAWRDNVAEADTVRSQAVAGLFFFLTVAGLGVLWYWAMSEKGSSFK